MKPTAFRIFMSLSLPSHSRAIAVSSRFTAWLDYLWLQRMAVFEKRNLRSHDALEDPFDSKNCCSTAGNTAVVASDRCLSPADRNRKGVARWSSPETCSSCMLLASSAGLILGCWTLSPLVEEYTPSTVMKVAFTPATVIVQADVISAIWSERSKGAAHAMLARIRLAQGTQPVVCGILTKHLLS